MLAFCRRLRVRRDAGVSIAHALAYGLWLNLRYDSNKPEHIGLILPLKYSFLILLRADLRGELDLIFFEEIELLASPAIRAG